MKDDEMHAERWARLRFAIVGPLLAAPPDSGKLRAVIQSIASRTWKHPVTGVPVRFSFTSVERWYYLAHAAQDPLAALRPQRRSDAGRSRRITGAVVSALAAQYRRHPGWTVQLHYDNLVALGALNPMEPGLQAPPSYATVRRHFRALGYHRKRTPRHQSPGAVQAAQHHEQMETRSYEADHAFALWHADFHHGRLKVLTASGRWVKPLLLGIIDDHSRLVCHLQWYLNETTESFVHGLSQALQKRGLPRALMTDNGAAMKAAEFGTGLLALGILWQPTLPYSPQQNAKQETFWATLEGRLMAMLEGTRDLTLARLNEISQVWVEGEYHRNQHAEIGTTPLVRFRDAKSVGRPCPDSATLRQAFRMVVTRKARRSDGTFSLAGRRYEIPSRYRFLETLRVRYARWDLSAVELLDPHTNTALCALYPLDKSANFDGQRRVLAPVAAIGSGAVSPDTTAMSSSSSSGTDADADELPPLLRKLMAEFAATGLPPAYIPAPSPE